MIERYRPTKPMVESELATVMKLIRPPQPKPVRKHSPKKQSKVETYQVGSDVVTLTKIKWPTSGQGCYAFDFRQPRSCYVVRLNRIKRGFIVYPHGYGTSKWELFGIGVDVESYRSHYIHVLPPFSKKRTREELASMIPEQVAAGRMPSLAELQARRVQNAERKRVREREDEAKHRHREKEWAANKKAAADARELIHDGLSSIQRFGNQLSNVEAHALAVAIQKFKPEREIELG